MIAPEPAFLRVVRPPSRSEPDAGQPADRDAPDFDDVLAECGDAPSAPDAIPAAVDAPEPATDAAIVAGVAATALLLAPTLPLPEAAPEPSPDASPDASIVATPAAPAIPPAGTAAPVAASPVLAENAPTAAVAPPIGPAAEPELMPAPAPVRSAAPEGRPEPEMPAAGPVLPLPAAAARPQPAPGAASVAAGPLPLPEAAAAVVPAPRQLPAPETPDAVALAAPSGDAPAAPAPAPPPLAAIRTDAAPAWTLIREPAHAAEPRHAPAVTHPAPAAVVGQVAVAIAAAEQPSVEIRLDPPELGRVQIHLTATDGGGLQATVLADRPETGDLLRRHAAQLARELGDAGFGEVSLDFATGGQPAPDDAPRPPRPTWSAPLAAAEPAPPATAVPSLTARGVGPLDIRL